MARYGAARDSTAASGGEVAVALPTLPARERHRMHVSSSRAQTALPRTASDPVAPARPAPAPPPPPPNMALAAIPTGHAPSPPARCHTPAAAPAAAARLGWPAAARPAPPPVSPPPAPAPLAAPPRAPREPRPPSYVRRSRFRSRASPPPPHD